MRLSAEVHLGEHSFDVQMFPGPQETFDHMALKLAARLFFHGFEPLISPSLQHAALQNQEFIPDLLAVTLTQEAILWVECGKTTANKLDKVVKKFRQARIIVLTATPHEARQALDLLERDGIARVEVWTFRHGDFAQWLRLISERNDIVGEANETSLNLVVNASVYVAELEKLER